MLTLSRPPIPVVVQQHAEESAILRNVRSVLVRAPHVKLLHLRRLDDRIAAHLDGLAVAGEFGTKLCLAALETPGVGEVFAVAVRAIEDKDTQGLARLLAIAQALPEGERGLISAFGWVSASLLQGTIKALLSADDPYGRRLAMDAPPDFGNDLFPMGLRRRRLLEGHAVGAPFHRGGSFPSQATPMPSAPVVPAPPPEMSDSEFLRERVDPVLEKLYADGPERLTPEEKAVLEEASRRFGKGKR